MIVYAEMGHPVGVYGGATAFLCASVGIDVHGTGYAGAGEVGIRVVGGDGFAVGGHFAFCAVWRELGVGGVLGGMGLEEEEGEETYRDGVATGAVVAVVELAYECAGGVVVVCVCWGVSCGERCARVREGERDILERRLGLGVGFVGSRT